MMEEMPDTIVNYILPLKCGFGYGIGQKYQPVWVSVSVLDLNQNSGFSRTLFKPVRQTRLQVLKGYCPNIYCYCGFSPLSLG